MVPVESFPRPLIAGKKTSWQRFVPSQLSLAKETLALQAVSQLIFYLTAPLHIDSLGAIRTQYGVAQMRLKMITTQPARPGSHPGGMALPIYVGGLHLGIANHGFKLESSFIYIFIYFFFFTR